MQMMAAADSKKARRRNAIVVVLYVPGYTLYIALAMANAKLIRARSPHSIVRRALFPGTFYVRRTMYSSRRYANRRLFASAASSSILIEERLKQTRFQWPFLPIAQQQRLKHVRVSPRSLDALMASCNDRAL